MGSSYDTTKQLMLLDLNTLKTKKRGHKNAIFCQSQNTIEYWKYSLYSDLNMQIFSSFQYICAFFLQVETYRQKSGVQKIVVPR